MARPAIPYVTEPLGLANIADGRLEAQFRKELERVQAAFEEAQESETTVEIKDGRVKASITMKIDMEFIPEIGALHCWTSAEAKLPRQKVSSGTAILRAGALFIEKHPPQESLLFRKTGPQPVE